MLSIRIWIIEADCANKRPSGVHRVEPLAMNGRDSVVEWLELPREEAAAFADESAGSLTWQMFQDFTYEGKGKNATVSGLS
jgi:hypothetical protein